MIQQYQTIPVQGITDPYQQLRVMRLNCLGSLFYFIRNALRRKRLTGSLHLPLCRSFEREHIKDVIEIPRDHFKSTCASEGLPMWRALPLSQQDIDDFYLLGYDDAFIRWMRKAHNPESRNLLVSGNITNAAKLGKRVRDHFESNSTYRALFPETLPDTSCVWSNYSLEVKKANGGHGEGTFDFLGVGSAAQSRHYNGIVIEDDLIGIKEAESQSLMDKAIDYHQLLVGIFEAIDPNHELDELVIGNRWGYADLNSWIKEHESEAVAGDGGFRFASHSALGGCCDAHPPNTPIFPEEFSEAKLLKRKQRLGNYKFSCQFLNNPTAPEDADFRVEWLNYFEMKWPDLGKWHIEFKVKNGIVRPDLKASRLNIAMIVDPNHSGNQGRGRCRHAIIVDGVDDEDNHYLLDAWAQAASYDTFYNKIFEIAMKFKLTRIGVETVAAQKYVAHHIQHLCATKGYSLRIDELKGEVDLGEGEISRRKEWRIRNVLAPIAEQGRLFVQERHVDFINEYQTFPKGRYVDQLDAFAYAPQLVRKPMDDATHFALLAANEAQMSKIGTPYSHGYANAGRSTGVFNA